jgi:chromosome partitioning protein
MIITFATQKEEQAKQLAIAFANYISSLSERKLNVFDFDFQKIFTISGRKMKVVIYQKYMMLKLLTLTRKNHFRILKH